MQGQRKKPGGTIYREHISSGTFFKAKNRLEKKAAQKRFAELYCMMMSAVNHEVGNSLCVLRNSQDNGKLGTSRDDKLSVMLDKIHSSYTWLLVMKDVIQSYDSPFDGKSAYVLPGNKGKELNLRIEGVPNRDIDKAKAIALEQTRILKKAFCELEAFQVHLACDLTTNEKSALMRILSCGKPLASCLEKLLCGDFDFDAEMASARICDESGPSLGRSIVRTGTFCDMALEFSFSEDITVKSVMANQVLLCIVFTNILSNAKSALESKGAKPAVDVRVFENGGVAIFEFKDSGCGMSSGVMEKLNSGIRVSTKKEGGEHGLGFDFCRRLAMKMGGRLYVKESVPDEGTVVALELPLTQE